MHYYNLTYFPPKVRGVGEECRTPGGTESPTCIPHHRQQNFISVRCNWQSCPKVFCWILMRLIFILLNYKQCAPQCAPPSNRCSIRCSCIAKYQQRAAMLWIQTTAHNLLARKSQKSKYLQTYLLNLVKYFVVTFNGFPSLPSRLIRGKIGARTW